MKKRLLSWLLILALCLSLLPAAALAEDAPEQTEAPVVREQTEAPTVQERTESVQTVNDTAVQAAHTNHPICGAAHTDIGDHTEDKCANVTWTAWDGTSDIVYDSSNTAYVYLSGNAERTEILTVKTGYTLYLCLNGYSLTKTTEDSNPGFEGVITIYQGAQFTLCDCRGGGKITHVEGALGRGVRCGDSSSGSRATFAMFGGEISGNYVGSTSGAGQDGAGVEVHNAIFNMYGGRIADNHVEKTSNDGGGGVYAHGSGSFTMYGGEISGNTSAGDGGGVSAVAASFTMKGGRIINNKAEATNAVGGGAALYNAAFELSGGTITGNSATRNGGGVYYSQNQSTSLTVSGSVNITGNKNAAGADDNVYLASGKHLAIGTDGLDENAKIGVTYADPIAAGSYVTVAYGANKGYTEGNITSDAGGTYSILREGDNVNLYNGLHKHPVCGAACGHTDEHTGVKWTAISSLSQINGAGYYYLTADVTTDNVANVYGWEPVDGVVLCLNGKRITGSVGGRTIRILKDITFTLTDCTSSGRLYNGAEKTQDQRGVEVAGGTFNMYGGKITGFHSSGGANGGGVLVRSDGASLGVFNMYGGSIVGNYALYGGGVSVGYYAASPGEFNMYGGSITGNRAAYYGGGVYAYRTCTINISGNVKIIDNIKDYRNSTTDNNVYLVRNKTINVTGPLTGGTSSIGVTTTDLLKDGCFIAIANGTDSYTLTDNEKDAFSEDEGSRFNSKLLRGNTLLLTRFVDIPMHEHALCGASCNHEDAHSSELWQPLTYYSSTQELYCGPAEANRSTDSRYTADNTTRVSYYSYTIPSGNYYLTGDLTLGGDGSSITGGVLMIEGDVKLCLNGKTLSTTTTANLVNVIKVDMDGSLTLCDCSSEGSGKITSENKVYTCVQPVGAQNTGKKSGKFTMYGGTLTGAYYGVALNDADSVALYGGTITGNTVGVSANYPVTIGGTVNITGNTNADVRLYNKNSGTGLIKIDPSLTQDSRIGVSSEQELSETIPSVKIATGATGTLDYKLIFTPNVIDQGYIITRDDAGDLYLTKHTHDWSYTAEGATITAACTDTTCTSKNGGSVTLKAPAGTLTYTGMDQPATLENNLKTGDEAPTIIYTYERNGHSYSIENGGLPRNADTYTASITLGGQSVSVQYTIDPKPITVEVDAVSRTYGDANPAFTATAPSGALVGSDTVASLGLTLTSTAIATSNVGTYDVTGTASNGNYAVTIYGTNKLTVTAKPITVTVDPATRAYGDENPAFTATAPSSALVGEDTVASLGLSLTTAADTTSPVGSYSVTGSASNGNYAVTVKGTDALAVTQRAVTLTVNAASRIYGDANPDFTAELTGGTYAPGDSFQSLGLTLSTTADQTTGVGEYDVTGTASNTNYKVTVLGEKKLTITQRPITVEVDAVSRTYGERNPNFTANTVKSGSLVNGDMLVLTLTTTADRTSPVGKYDVTLASSDSPNYAVTVEGKDKLTVTAKAITVTVTPVTRAYGDANPAFTAAAPSGALVGNDTIASLGLRLSSTATATSPVGKYDVTGTANNANYTVTVEGTNVLTVEPKTITVTAEDKSSRVGYELVELTYTYTPALLDGAAFNGKLATNANKDVVGDQYTITQGTLELNANYAIVFNAGKYTVTSKLTQDSFAFADSTIQKTYGDPNFLVAATGAETGSNVTYALDPSSDSSIAEVAADGTVTIKKTGTVIITATAAATRDYAEATANCTLVIERAKLTVTALDKKITVHQSAPDLSNPIEGEDYTVTGTLFVADALTAVTLTYSETPDTSKVGEYIINITATLANYDITTVPGTLTIEPSKSTQRLGILDGTRTVPGGTIETSPKNALPGQTVTITVTPQKGYELGGLTVRDIAGGQLTLTRESDREYTFVMPDSSVSVTGYFVREGETMFRDVPADAYYYEAVQWAVETGVTGGVGDDLFAPDAACTRAQIVTFLWRAAGSPEPQSKADFTDVPANAYYAKAVAWALENGITKGTSATTFSPDDPCTRAQAVTFLARALSAKAEGTADFLDVAESAYYCGAVAWAAENDVTSGVGGKRFAPDQTCTRAQIVTFLYRAYNK